MVNEYAKYSDEELIVQLRDGDHAITDYIMEKYKNLVRSKAQSMYILGADREDLIQEGMIGLFKAVQSYQSDKDASFRRKRMSWKVPGGIILKISSLSRNGRGALNRRSTGR